MAAFQPPNWSFVSLNDYALLWMCIVVFDVPKADQQQTAGLDGPAVPHNISKQFVWFNFSLIIKIHKEQNIEIIIIIQNNECVYYFN